MGFVDSLKTKAAIIKAELAVLYYAYRNPAMPLAPKLVILFTIGYALSPIDLIPDFIPVIGYLDDLILIPVLIKLALRLIPPSIIEPARKQAAEKPLHLSKNWGFAIFIIAVWIALIAWIVGFFI